MLWSISEAATFLKIFFRSSHRRCSVKIGFLKSFANFTEKAPVLKSVFNKVAIDVSCEICKIFRSTYFEEHLRTTAPEETPLLEVFEI